MAFSNFFFCSLDQRNIKYQASFEHLFTSRLMFGIVLYSVCTLLFVTCSVTVYTEVLNNGGG